MFSSTYPESCTVTQMDARRVEKYRQQLHSRLPLIGGWLQDQALKTLLEDGSAEAVRVLTEAVANVEGEVRRARALESLRQLAEAGNAAAQEALCRLVIDCAHPLARAIVSAGGYLPHEAVPRALFYFLTGQWEAYESLDFDHRLLRQAYDEADKRLRRRIAAQARQAGRLEWVDIVSGGKPGRRLGEMTDDEWETATTVLEAGRRWGELWRLAQEAPPRWSARILLRLKKARWPVKEDERTGFEELARLAKGWKERDLSALFFHGATLEGHSHAIRCLAITPSGRILVSGSSDHTVRLWHLPGGRPLRTLEGHAGWINCLAVTPDGELLASAGRDGRICLWRVPSGELVKTLEGHIETVFALAVNPDGQLLASSSADHTVRLWSLPEGALVKTLIGHTGPVSCLAVSPTGDLLASGSADCTVRVWNLPEGRAWKVLHGHRTERGDGILCLAISPDGRILASGATDNTARLWSLPGGRALAKLRLHTGNISALAIGSDGKLLATAGGDYTVQLWRLPSGRLVKTLDGHVNENSSLVMSADGRLLATGSGGGWGPDHTVRIWDLVHQRAVQYLSGHKGCVTCLALSPDGGLLASGAGDSTIRLWFEELKRLSRLQLGQTTLKDLEWLQDVLRTDSLPDVERKALEFITALMRWRRRADVLVDEAAPRVIELGEFDIEID